MRWLTRRKPFDPADLLAYIWENYGEEGDQQFKENRAEDFTLSRTTKMIYLVDWKYALKRGRQATLVRWYFDQFGPYVNLVTTFTKRFDLRQEKESKSKYLRRIRWLSLNPDISKDVGNPLSNEVKDVCKDVIEDVGHLSYLDFIRYVYRTPPVRYCAKFRHMNIVRIAKYF